MLLQQGMLQAVDEVSLEAQHGTPMNFPGP